MFSSPTTIMLLRLTHVSMMTNTPSFSLIVIQFMPVKTFVNTSSKSSHMSSFVLFQQVVSTIDLFCLGFMSPSGIGIFQPADVGLNQVIKHRLKQHQSQYLVESHHQQLKSGLTAEQVKIMTSLPVLWDKSVAGIVSVYEFMTSPFGHELV